MLQVVICSPNIKELYPNDKSIQTIDMEGVPVTCALVETPDPGFDPALKENSYKVLVKKRAFSCNYRDRAFILTTALKCNQSKGDKIDAGSVGSDFVADVIAVGSKVKDLKPGDRVIGDGHYPAGPKDFLIGPEYEGVNIGLPTNNASREMDVFHCRKLMKIPAGMSDEVAASFMVGGITSYSMLRKLNIQDGDTILVTAAKSNTSLFILSALKKWKKKKKIKIYATSGSRKYEKRLKEMGVDELFISEPGNPLLFDKKSLDKIQSQRIFFTCVIDPFFDLFFGKVVKYMPFGARYTTCGLQDQHHDLVGLAPTRNNQGPELTYAISQLMMFNMVFVGNCVGLTSDLKQAVRDHVKQDFDVQVDSVYEGIDVAAFFERTYKAKNRWGKVVYKFPA